jgi:uncharacterized protein (DUF433 family)
MALYNEADTPITEAELAEWETRARTSRARTRGLMLRLIAEVRRLRAALSEELPDDYPGAAAELDAGAAKENRQEIQPGLVIVRHPGVCGGAPTFEGTRIGIHDVVGYAQAYGGDLDRVREEALPSLSMEQVRRAMEWYRDHQQEIDDILRRHQESYERGLAAARGRA